MTVLFFALCTFLGWPTLAAPPDFSSIAIRDFCLKEFAAQTKLSAAWRLELCSAFKNENECVSEKGLLIPHFERSGSSEAPVRILVFGQIHGDEADAGILAYQWTERLFSLFPKNTWRVIPKLNPDGHQLKTRMNANGVDLNRNFPTRDWDVLALSAWKDREKSNPRRYPGPQAGTESETRCAIHHIKTFHPEIVVSLHTPYGLIDFDRNSPKRIPPFGLPWKSLGTFPGSLGRYMWAERNTPVLTVELAPTSMKLNRSSFDQLQDFISLLIKPEGSKPLGRNQKISGKIWN